MTEPTPSEESPPATTVPAREPAAKRLRWWIHLLLIAAYPLAAGMMSSSAGGSRRPALSETPVGLVLNTGVNLLIFALVLGLACLASRPSRDDLLLRWRNGIWPVPLGIGYSIALRIVLAMAAIGVSVVLIATRLMTPSALSSLVMVNRPRVEAIVGVSALRDNPLYFVLAVTLVSFVLGGLREELWRSAFLGGMRALWPGRFGSQAGQIVAVAIAAILFGLGHLSQGVMAIGLTALLGFGLGLIMVLHRSIWPAVIAHGMFDATSLALIPWALEKLQQVQQTLGH
jgi:membrane protease YdiL (CAAX protease family)